MTRAYSKTRSPKRPLTEAEIRRNECGAAFHKRWRNEKLCWDAFIERLKSVGLFYCSRCHSYDLRRKGMRTVVCHDCKAERSASSGTLFERVRDLLPYFAAMWFLEHGVVVTSVWLAKFTELSQSSSLCLLRKLRIVAGSQMGEGADRLFSRVFSETMSRRSLETPARLHPREEESELNKAGGGAGAAATGGAAVSGTATGSSTFSASRGAGPVAGPSAAPGASSSTGKPKKNIWKPFARRMAPKNLQRRTSQDYPNLDGAPKLVFDLLSDGPLSFDQLIAKSNLSPNELACALTMLELELDGLIVETGGVYDQKPIEADEEYYEDAEDEPLEELDEEPEDELGDELDGDSDVEAEADACADVDPDSSELIKESECNVPVTRRSTFGVSFLSPLTKKLQKNLQEFIKDNFKGVSRKYLQLYISDYWLSWDRERWPPDSLLIEGLLFDPISYQQVLQFVTAPIVRVRGKPHVRA